MNFINSERITEELVTMPEFDQKSLCPSCRKIILLPTPIGVQGIVCPHCQALYPKTEGFLDFLPPAPTGQSVAQKFMDRPRFISAYEGKYWRKSIFFAFIAGISFSHEFDLITKAADLSGTEVILDLSCGPGIYTRPWAKKLAQGFAVGLDISKPMLSYAVAKAEEEKIKNILFVHASALSIPFPDGAFDRVNFCGALHLFPHVEKVLGEIHRVMKPGGILTTASARNWLPGKLSDRIFAWYKKLGVTHFRHHELVAYFKEAGFEEINTLHAKHCLFIITAAKSS
ncbi:MAG: methyltransferase domain-containing protein [Desulfobacteraceae bacterium]|nr:methyltransferase domain-containing protein [Desulfobacteraceae bacterium]